VCEVSVSNVYVCDVCEISVSNVYVCAGELYVYACVSVYILMYMKIC